MSHAAAPTIPSLVDAAPPPHRAPHYEAVVGTLTAIADDEGVTVEFETADGAISRRNALSTVELDVSAVGHPVLLMFVGGDLDCPVITGRVQPGRASPRKITRTRTLVLDGRELVLEADSTLTLRCGRSSITLTREGRIVLRGTNVVSHASGVNRIRGGTIKLTDLAMPHADFDNRTAFFADALHLVDERFAPLLTVAVKGTFEILPGGALALCAEQPPLDPVGRLQDPEAEQSSYRYEPEVAPFKLSTDVVFVGHAHAPDTRTRRMDVGLRVGPLSRSLRVFGDRVWIRALGGPVLTPPLPFETVPICYERAFGGWDLGSPDPRKHTFEPRNPVGRGYHGRWGRARDRVLAPNLESIQHPIRSPHDRPVPACFGFVSPHWQPRLGLAGTHDAAWREHRFPLLPTDFDRRHYNAASPGLVAPGHLRGDEDVKAIGLAPEGHLAFSLPDVPPPTARVRVRDQPDHQLVTALDTVVIDLDDRCLTMIWRVSLPLPNGPHDVRAVEVTCDSSLALPHTDTITEPRRSANDVERGASTCP